MFFDILSELCAKKGVSPYKACTDMGLNRSAVAKWKNGATPNGATIAKMSEYFEVSTDFLLSGEKEKPAAESSEQRDPLIAELISYAEGADEDGVRMLIEMAKRLQGSSKD